MIVAAGQNVANSCQGRPPTLCKPYDQDSERETVEFLLRGCQWPARDGDSKQRVRQVAGAVSSQGQSATCPDVGTTSTVVTSPAPRGRPLFFPQLAVQAASEHLDRRALLRVGKIEADDFGRLARRRVVELENRVTGRLEETVAGFEQLNRLAFQLKVESFRPSPPHSRDRMTMQSRRLPRRKFDASAFDQANGWVRRGQFLFQERFALQRREVRVGHSDRLYV